MGKLWGGRFGVETDEVMEQFGDSIRFDWRLYRADIRGSQAYARALIGAGILTAEESEQNQSYEKVWHGRQNRLPTAQRKSTDHPIHRPMEFISR